LAVVWVSDEAQEETLGTTAMISLVGDIFSAMNRTRRARGAPHYGHNMTAHDRDTDGALTISG
jgi:hypothetical protein